jgi:TolB-like protein/tetratricopeptide (TPR) repeat protein
MPDQPAGYQRFFAELKRRRVFRVMAVYGAAAFVVLQVADILQDGLRLPDSFLPFITATALLGFPVAIALAWAFDLTPEGMQRTGEAAPGELTEIIAAPASKRWPAGLLALVGMVALVAGAWYVGRQSASPADASIAAMAAAMDPAAATGPAPESIAVLPFVNMSSDPEQEYFSDGISEELLNLLAQIPALQVTSRSSAFSFKDKDLEIPEIARRLNVAHVLEGSVRKSGDQVRITAQLIDARSDTHLWSETWDRTLDDIFAVQDEIAADVAEQLQVELLGTAPAAQAVDPEAYALVLQARQLAYQFTEEGLERSNELYRAALEIDPDYAAAWSGLSANYGNQAAYDLGPLEESYRLAREAADRALEIDPDFAPALAGLGAIEVWYDLDFGAAASHYSRALTLDPTNPEILLGGALLTEVLNRGPEAIEVYEYLIPLDPINPSLHSAIAFAYWNSGRYEESLESTRTTLALSPEYIGSHYSAGGAIEDLGDPEAALAETEKEVYEPYRLLGLTRIHNEMGHAAESDAALQELIDRYADGWAYNIAYTFALRGEADPAFEWLDRAIANRDAGLAQLGSTKLFDKIADDPRWLPLLENLGMTPEQLAAIEFEVELPVRR